MDNKLRCFFCADPIPPGELNLHHHPKMKSEGGTILVSTCASCHRAYHQNRGDFRKFGRIGGLKAAKLFAWAKTLKHVKFHPKYEIHRKIYEEKCQKMI